MNDHDAIRANVDGPRRDLRLPLMWLFLIVSFFVSFSVFAGSFSPGATLPKGLTKHTATPLSSGKILVVGGFDSTFNISTSAYLYDPGTDSWSTVASMGTPRDEHTATLLPSGKVLVAGGINGVGIPANAELYDPVANTWTAAGTLTTGRYEHTATLLGSGKVLVVGGTRGIPIASAELYDPATNTWSAGGSLATGRYLHTATQLSSGKVLVVGGYNSSSTTTNSVELFDPSTNIWSPAASLASMPASHTATLLASGKVLVACGQSAVGGVTPTTTTLTSANIYDPAANTWSAAGTLTGARYQHTAALLLTGDVLVAGGENSSSSVATAEVYSPASNTWSATGSLAAGRYGHTATLANGQVLEVGGINGTVMVNTTILASTELYNPFQQGASTTTLSSNANPSFFGQSITFTASVSGTGTPTGSVTFKDGATTLCANVALSNGSATCTTGTLMAGTHSMSAAYGGDLLNFASSGNLTQTVNKADTTTTLLSGTNPSTYGQNVVLTANVSGQTTGSVTFYDSSTAICSNVSLNAGSASCTTNALTVGSHALSAIYSGDTNNNGSTSFAIVQQVNQATSITVLASDTNPSTVGQSVTFTATAFGQSPSGSVVFKDGSNVICTSPLSAGSATCTTSVLAAGTHSFTAVYGGDTNNGGSTSNSVMQQVNKVTSATSLATNCMTTFVELQPFTMTASVSGATPTGTVTFHQGATILCGNVALNSGTASCSTNMLAVMGSDPKDTYNLIASYAGDSSNASSDSSALSVTVLSASDVIHRNGFEVETASCPIE
jgi:N-acetylneuraminic acid mutarotase